MNYAFWGPSRTVLCDLEKKSIFNDFWPFFEQFWPETSNFDQIRKFSKNNKNSHIWAAIYEKSSLNNNDKGLNCIFEIVNFFLHPVYTDSVGQIETAYSGVAKGGMPPPSYFGLVDNHDVIDGVFKTSQKISIFNS